MSKVDLGRLSSDFYYHISLKGINGQDLFIRESDMIIASNSMALAAARTNTLILMPKIIENHLHVIAGTDDVSAFIHYFRQSLSQNLNRRNGTRGIVGNRHCSVGLLGNLKKLKDRICYVARNEVRHNISSNIFNQKFCPVDLFFNDRSIPVEDVCLNEDLLRAFIPQYDRLGLPQGYVVDYSGLILPQSYVSFTVVEEIFETKENFYDSLLTKTEIEVQLDKQKSETRNAGSNPSEYYTLGAKIKGNQTFVRDLEVSERLETFMRANSCKCSLHQMNTKERFQIAKAFLHDNPSISVRQMARVIMMPESSLRYYLKGM